MAELTPSSENRGPLERDIQAFLVGNLSALGEDLTLVGTEYAVSTGRVDILAQDMIGSLVVIELKVGVANRDAIGQLQSYMGALHDNHPQTFVRGILVAGSLDVGAEVAPRVTRNISFVSYAISFLFSRSMESPSTYAEWKARMTPSAEPAPATKSRLWLPPSFGN